MHGTIKADIIEDGGNLDILSSCIIYDNKTAHLLGTVAYKITRKQQKRKIRDKAKNAFLEIYDFRIKVIDNYNYGMGGVDVDDQLSPQYRLWHFIHHRKRWC